MVPRGLIRDIFADFRSSCTQEILKCNGQIAMTFTLHTLIHPVLDHPYVPLVAPSRENVKFIRVISLNPVGRLILIWWHS